MATFNGQISVARVAASTLAVGRPCQVLGISAAHTAAAAPLPIIIQDSLTSTGGTVAVIDMVGMGYIEFPGQGIKCSTGVYVDIGGAEGVSIYFG